MRRMFSVLILVAFATVAFAQQQTVKVLVMNAAPAAVEEFKTATPLARIVVATPQNVMQEIADADAFIGNITPAQVRAGKKLRWVGVMSAGVENVLHLAGGTDLRDSKIVLTNNQIVQGPEIADHAMA